MSSFHLFRKVLLGYLFNDGFCTPFWSLFFHPMSIHSLDPQFARLPRVREGIPTRVRLIPQPRLPPPCGPPHGDARSLARTVPGGYPSEEARCSLSPSGRRSGKEAESHCLGKSGEEARKCVGRKASLSPRLGPCTVLGGGGSLNPSVPNPNPAQGTLHLLQGFSPFHPRGKGQTAGQPLSAMAFALGGLSFYFVAFLC